MTSAADTRPDTRAAAALVRPAGEARTLELLGVRITFLVTAADTGGAWSLLEYTAPPRFTGPAPHYHERTTELFHVLGGELTMRLGEDASETRTLTPGGLALVPPGAVHAFRNDTDTPVRFLIQFTPGGPENYFVELDDLMKSAPSWPHADLRPVAELAARHDTVSAAR